MNKDCINKCRIGDSILWKDDNRSQVVGRDVFGLPIVEAVNVMGIKIGRFALKEYHFGMIVKIIKALK